MLSPDDGVNACVDSPDVLMKLSNVLGCPVEAFFDLASHELGQTVEILRLWSLIDNSSDRAKLLAMTRLLAARG